MENSTQPAAGPAASQRFDEPAGIFALWFGVLGPPIIWLARLKIGYILVPYACWTGWTVMLHAVTFVTLALTASAGLVAWRSWQSVGKQQDSDGPGRLHRTRFLAIVGLLSAALFFVVITAEGLLNFLIDPCITGGQRVP